MKQGINRWIRLCLIVLAVIIAFWSGYFSANHSQILNVSREVPPASQTSKKYAPEESLSEWTADGKSSAMTIGSTDTLDQLLASLDTKKRWAALAAYGKKTASANPAKAWGLLSQIGGLADRQVFAESVIAEWAKTSPQAAIAAAQTLTTGELKASAMAAAIGQWAQSSPMGAMDFAAKNLTGSSRQMAVSAAAIEWARSDAQAAAQWALSNQESTSGIQAIGEIMEFWGDTNPQSGADWAAKLPASLFQKQALQSILSKWTDQFPGESAEWIAKQPLLDDLKPLVAAQWAKSDPAAAAAWAFSLPDSQNRETAALEVAGAWAASAPQEALAWIDKNSGSQRNSLQIQAVETWAVDDPAAALAWANGQPESSKLSKAIMNRWAETNTKGFISWADKLPSAQKTDTIRSIVALNLSDTEPQTAIQSAVSMTDSSLRTESIEGVLSAWKRNDQAGAKNWISNNQQLLKAR
jgi:hypothetical protein